MAEQMKPQHKYKGRRSYLNDFHQTLSGEYIYCGSRYNFRGSPRERHTLLARLSGLGALMAIGSVICGCIRTPGTSNTFYVILPYFATMMAVVSLIWALARLINGGASLMEHVYNGSVMAIPRRAAYTMALSLLAVLGEIVYVLRNGTGGHTPECIFFLFSHTLIFVSAFLWRQLTARSVWDRDDSQKQNRTL